MKRNTDKTDELAECCKFKAKRCKPSSTFQVKRLCPGSKVPTRGSKGSAGWDLYACIDRLVSKRSNGSPVKSFGEKILVDSRKAVRVAPHGKALIDTGCAYAIEPGYYGRIAPRSSLAWKNHIDVGAGVIDSDYRYFSLLFFIIFCFVCRNMWFLCNTFLQRRSQGGIIQSFFY